MIEKFKKNMEKSIQQKLADKIYEILPHKKDLEFGCEVKFKDKYYLYIGLAVEKDRISITEKIKPFNRKVIHINSHFEIIGQPIRLADILIAIGKFDHGVKITSTGILFRSIFSNGKECPVYNLSKDNLLDQSDELCELIYNLIKK